MEPSTMQFFYDLGIPVVNGYGLTEAGTVLTVNDLKPFRADTVGKPLPGVELRVLSPNEEGIGEIAARSKTVMSHYLDDAELTLETIVDGWLLTGDLGRFDKSGHLQLFGRKKNMIVTEGGKNIYPEDIETVFDGLPVKEYCVFAANYVWPQKAGKRDAGDGAAAGTESAIRQRAAGRNRDPQPTAAGLQTRGRLCDLRERFSADGVDENQAAGAGGRIGEDGESGSGGGAVNERRESYLAIVNPAAGGGRSRKMLGPALERLRAGGVEVEVVETQGVGDATRIAREAYGRGRRRFIAVGGDGTSYEVVNGLFPEASAGEPSHARVFAAGDGEFLFARFQ